MALDSEVLLFCFVFFFFLWVFLLAFFFHIRSSLFSKG